MNTWTETTLGNLCSIKIGGTPSRNNPLFWDTNKEEANHWVSIRDLNKKRIDSTDERITSLGVSRSNAKLVKKETILLSFKLTIGKVAYANVDLYTNEAIAALETDKIDNDFLFQGLQHWNLLQDVDQAIKGATLNKEKLHKIVVEIPTSKVEQKRIAAILSTADEAIERTQALIDKYNRIKRGLMQDLLTRGIDENGNIRSKQTHRFTVKNGIEVPDDWDVVPFEEVMESAVDGPFGSNLKSEHYVNEGVRVVRLQNIGEGFFNDKDKAFVSFEHAEKLKRHKIVSDDLIVASMGDVTHPIARACLYPNNLDAGIVKADCFRVRINKNIGLNSYLRYILNCESTRKDIDILGQGVTRERINLTKLKEIRIRKPSLPEQKKIVETLDLIAQNINDENLKLAKFQAVKKGLMQDLLSGKVRVKLENENGA